MKRLIGCAVVTLWVAASGTQAKRMAFRPYPNAKLDKAAAAAASKEQIGTQVEVYTTNDSFEKVNAFYKSLYKEYVMPANPPKMDSGQQVRWGFFIMDGGKDMRSSQHWMKIQRPYIGSTKLVEGKMVSSDVRGVTVIEVVRKR